MKNEKLETEDKNIKYDIIICGVGGQGAILASDVFGRAAVVQNYNVQAAETHGMAQRGGSVENHVRIGATEGSLIPEKSGDILIGLEPAEALRYTHLLKDDGIVILNTNKVLPTTVTSGKSKYPDLEKIINLLKTKYKVYAFNATEKAEEAGNRQAMNVVMIGASSNFVPLEEEVLKSCIKKIIPPKTVDVNMKAFEMGKKQIEN